MKKQYKNIKYALKSFNAKEVIRKTNKDMLATLILFFYFSSGK